MASLTSPPSVPRDSPPTRSVARGTRTSFVEFGEDGTRCRGLIPKLFGLFASVDRSAASPHCAGTESGCLAITACMSLWQATPRGCVPRREQRSTGGLAMARPTAPLTRWPTRWRMPASAFLGSSPSSRSTRPSISSSAHLSSCGPRCRGSLHRPEICCRLPMLRVSRGSRPSPATGCGDGVCGYARRSESPGSGVWMCLSATASFLSSTAGGTTPMTRHSTRIGVATSSWFAGATSFCG